MRFEIWQTWLRRQWRWRLLSANNQTIANSGESYFNKGDCVHAIDLVMSTSTLTPVEERE